MESTNATTPTKFQRVSVTALPVEPPPALDAVYDVHDFPDASLFAETTVFPAVSVPTPHTAYYKKVLATCLVQGRKNVHPDERDANRRILLLHPGVTWDDVVLAVPTLTIGSSGTSDTTEPGTTDQTQDDNVEWRKDGLTITTHYTDTTIFTAETLLRKLLPPNITEIPSSFESVGHIAHVNLRPDCLPYKYWIGKVLLDCHGPTIQTVVNKIGTISDHQCVYRTFAMEVLAGRGMQDGAGDASPAKHSTWSVTKVHEHGCTFALDYRHVYWNSRLSGEHHRLVQLIRTDAATLTWTEEDTTVVADAMAGVGPFAIPLTSTSLVHASARSLSRQRRKHKGDPTTGPPPPPMPTPNPPRITVYANDLNPTSYHYLTHNAHLNQCPSTALHASNTDARAFLHSLADRAVTLHHVILNLPASAPEFLDALRGWPVTCVPRAPRRLWIHVHCFAGKPKGIAAAKNGPTTVNDPHEEAIERCARALGCPLDKDAVTVHIVRDISPGKNMVCVSFGLPVAVHSLARIDLSPMATNVPQDSITIEPMIRPGSPSEGLSKRAKISEL